MNNRALLHSTSRDSIPIQMEALVSLWHGYLSSALTRHATHGRMDMHERARGEGHHLDARCLPRLVAMRCRAAAFERRRVLPGRALAKSVPNCGTGAAFSAAETGADVQLVAEVRDS